MMLLTRCKSLWTRTLLQGVHHGDRHRQFDVLYRVRDPWGLDCDRERVRFEATNRIIRREFGTVGSLLELGCGEGLQSRYLAAVCDKLYGVDVSPVAVHRARQCCPNASFHSGDIMLIDRVAGCDRFDLVAACEILYYIKDISGFLDRMSTLGQACVVTYYIAHNARLDREIARFPNVKSEVIRYKDAEWLAAWWVNASSAAQPT